MSAKLTLEESNKKKGQLPATIPQAAKVLSALGGADRMTMQRLAGGIASDIAAADLTGITRFDLCQYLRVDLPFFVPLGTGVSRREEIPVDNETPLLELLRKVGGDNFSKLEEKEKGPGFADFFIINPEGRSKHYLTLASARKMVRAFDLKLATAREMVSYSLRNNGLISHPSPFGVPFLLCGEDEFCPPRWRHLLFFPCSHDTRKLNSLEHECAYLEEFEGERSEGYLQSPRVYLVRRMTKEEIIARQDLP